MGSYIKAKSDSTNSNDVKDLECIGKVKSKFNPQVPKTLVSNKDKETVKPTYIFPLLPPILAKTPKEVNEVSKYFTKVDVL